MITLVIKGDTAAAFAAADAHKVELTSVVKHARYDQCICTAMPGTYKATLQDWFDESTYQGTALPFGALLWFTMGEPT